MDLYKQVECKYKFECSWNLEAFSESGLRLVCIVLWVRGV